LSTAEAVVGRFEQGHTPVIRSISASTVKFDPLAYDAAIREYRRSHSDKDRKDRSDEVLRMMLLNR